MKVLITGAGGQLGKELIKTLSTAGYTVLPFRKEQLDITNQQAVECIFRTLSPEMVINCAAYTNVDHCEEEVHKAFLINGVGPYFLALEAKKINASFFHISTDYVFSGDHCTPYMEADEPEPKTIYGKSKRLGEELVLLANSHSTIIRTSWLYGQGGGNFVKTILKLSRVRQELKIVKDQIGSPTYVKDLAEATLKLIQRPFGIYHVTNSGSCSWYEFAKQIVLESGNNGTSVIPISTEEYPVQTPRPKYSVLSHRELNKVGIKMRHWKEALKEYLIEEMNNPND